MSILSSNLDNKIFWQLDIQNRTWCIPFFLMAGSFTSCWCNHHLFKGSVSTLTTPCKLNIARTQNYLEHVSRLKHGWFGYPCFKFQGYLNKQPRYFFVCVAPPPLFLLRSPDFAAVALPKVCYDTRPQNPVVCYMDGIGFDGVWPTTSMGRVHLPTWMIIFRWEVEERMQSSHGSCGCSSESKRFMDVLGLSLINQAYWKLVKLVCWHFYEIGGGDSQQKL